MLLEKLFGSTFGLIWLLIFIVVVFVLIIWLLIKKDNVCVNSDEQVESTSNIDINEEKEVFAQENKVVEESKYENKEHVSPNSEYEIIESEDGFFRVRKVGTERTLRKFATMEEAKAFIKGKENK